jgi:hypothetical protein
MTQLAQAFGANFNKDNVRIRSFEFGGHTFKVKVPLTSEYEALLDLANKVNNEKVDKYYAEITKEFVKNKDKITPDMGVVFEDNDVIVKDKSMREAAKNKSITENRIVAMVSLLVPEEKDFDMSTVTYAMVEELFPFSVQLELIDLISNTIAPNYKDQKGK